MRYLILFIFIVLSQPVLAKDIIILTPHTYSYSKYEYSNIKLFDAFEKNDHIKRYFLNCTPNCTENILQTRFNNIWKKIVDENPEYLIIQGNVIYNRFQNEIDEYAKTHQVGIFNFYLNEGIKSKIKKDCKIFFSVKQTTIYPLLNYFTNNAKKFNKYYILRDDCKFNLLKSYDLKRDLQNVDLSFDVKIVQLIDFNHLKNFIASIQDEEQCLIVVFINALKSNSKIININNISKAIVVHNHRHVLASTDLDLSEYFHVALVDNLIHQNYPDGWLDETSDIQFFLNHKFEEAYFFYSDRLMIINTSEISKLYNGYQLLKYTSSFVDIYR